MFAASGYFRYSIALLSIIGFCSSSHDIVADGLYIASLNPKQQSAYAGWQGGFFNVARFFAQGGLIILAGFLETRMPVLRAWMIIFGSLGVILVLLGLYHARMLPSGGEDRHSGNIKEVARTYWDVVAQLFPKAQHHSVIDFHFSLPRGRRATGEDRPLISQSCTRRSWTGPEHGTVRNYLRHAGDRGIYWRYGAWRLLHFLARTEAGHRSADHHHEPA